VSGGESVISEGYALINFVDSWISRFFVLDLPESLGKQTIIGFDLPSGFPLSDVFPDRVEFDLSDFAFLSILRQIEVASLVVFGVFEAIRIVRSTFI
ncbi:hypothetical protein P4E94_19640, partial [Pontiellaceae bacterium B12219]|nr:hypothetical protein [Pontiellaceae bacterium B12219]